ncbi:MAG: hypothetical protein WC005_06365 [Candidatus Nanopelagicales bacterium]
MSVEMNGSIQDQAWIEQHYLASLADISRPVSAPEHAARVHSACWNHTLYHPATKDVVRRLPIDALIELRDARLVQVIAERYGYQVAELEPYLDEEF